MTIHGQKWPFLDARVNDILFRDESWPWPWVLRVHKKFLCTLARQSGLVTSYKERTAFPLVLHVKTEIPSEVWYHSTSSVKISARISENLKCVMRTVQAASGRGKYPWVGLG